MIEVWVLMLKLVVFKVVLDVVLVLVGGVEAAGLKARFWALWVEHRGEERRGDLYL